MAGSMASTSILPTQAAILPSKKRLCGILEKVEPVGEGLVFVSMSGLEALVDESLFGALQGLMGKRTAIWHIPGGLWGACEAAIV